MDDRANNKQFEISLYISKYLIPVLERKWIVLSIFLVCFLSSLVMTSLIRPEFITSATMLIEEPRSRIPSRSRYETGDVVPENAPQGYITNEVQKLQRGFFAAEVLNILPDEAKQDLNTRLGTGSQITERIMKLFGKEPAPPSKLLNGNGLLAEMQGRLSVRNGFGTSIIKLSVRTVKKEAGPILINSYIDVWKGGNLEENRKEIRAKVKFAKEQKGKAYHELQKSEEEMIAFRRRYQMPADQQVARDIEVQLEMDRARANLELAQNRFNMMDQIYIETRMKEAGIVGNITLIGPPETTFAPARIAGKKIIIIGIIAGLVLGIGLALMLDYIKGPIRHESDIIDTVRIPIMGHIPRV